MKKEKWHVVVIGVLCFTIAASICVQYRSVQSYITTGKATVQSMTENKLRDQVLKEQENYNKLNIQMQIAQQQLEDLRKTSASNSEEAKNLEEELSEYNRYIEVTTYIRNLVKSYSYKEQILDFVFSEDFYFFIENNSWKQVLKLFYPILDV